MRSILEYACVFVDPYTKELVDTLENIQNMSVRFVLGNWHAQLSMRESKSKLKWQDVKDHRRNHRLNVFRNIYDSKNGVEGEKYVQAPFYISQSGTASLKQIINFPLKVTPCAIHFILHQYCSVIIFHV